MDTNRIISLEKSKNSSLVQMFSDSNVLVEKDYNDLMESKDFIMDSFLSVPMYRTLPTKLFGVLNSVEFPTPESKLWQCKIEAEVHGNELIRDLHELEIKKIKIEELDYMIYNVMEQRFHEEKDTVKQKEIEFDIKKQKVYLSLAKFEFTQLQKRIKYRIQEVSEWKDISEHLLKSGVKPENYQKAIVTSLKRKWETDLQKPEITEEDKKIINAKLNTLNSAYKLGTVE